MWTSDTLFEPHANGKWKRVVWSVDCRVCLACCAAVIVVTVQPFLVGVSIFFVSCCSTSAKNQPKACLNHGKLNLSPPHFATVQIKMNTLRKSPPLRTHIHSSKHTHTHTGSKNTRFAAGFEKRTVRKHQITGGNLMVWNFLFFILECRTNFMWASDIESEWERQWEWGESDSENESETDNAGERATARVKARVRMKVRWEPVRMG